jgi:hypothetical protein
VPSRPPDHQLPIRHGHGVRRPNRCVLLFATLANRATSQRSRADSVSHAFAREHCRQGPWLPAGREFGITTIAERGPARPSSKAVGRTRVRGGARGGRLKLTDTSGPGEIRRSCSTVPARSRRGRPSG